MKKHIDKPWDKRLYILGPIHDLVDFPEFFQAGDLQREKVYCGKLNIGFGAYGRRTAEKPSSCLQLPSPLSYQPQAGLTRPGGSTLRICYSGSMINGSTIIDALFENNRDHFFRIFARCLISRDASFEL
jgi:hypothetical protein